MKFLSSSKSLTGEIWWWNHVSETLLHLRREGINETEENKEVSILFSGLKEIRNLFEILL